MLSTTHLAEHLLQSAPEHQAWSLVESTNAAGSYERLRQWAICMGSWNWKNDFRIRKPYLGLVLLWLESEVARRQGGDGSLWPVLSNRDVVPWSESVHAELFTSEGHATQQHRELLRCAAEHFSLRHSFDCSEGQQWYRLIYLQFGFTRDDAVRRLSGWLSGQVLPVSVQNLLEANDEGGQTFQHIWYSLRMFRLGNLAKSTLEARLQSSPWVLPEWCSDLIDAARRSSAQILGMGEVEAGEVPFFTVPKLIWSDSDGPRFVTSLCFLDQRGLQAADYELKVGELVLAKLIRQADGSYYCDTPDGIFLPNQPTVALSLVDGSGDIIAHDEAQLWSPMEVTLYSARTGNLLKEGERLRRGLPVLLIASDDLTIRPEPTASTELALGCRLHRLAAGWTGQLEAALDDDVLWCSSQESAPRRAPTAISKPFAVFPETLDLAAHQWRNVSAPWELPIQIHVPSGCQFIQMRWRRADGQLVRFLECPTHLTLTERDVVRPLVFHLQLAFNGSTWTEVLKVSVPFVAAIRWTRSGRPFHHPPARKLLLHDARQQTWTFNLPPRDRTPRDPRLCSFVEGRMLHDRLKARPSVLPDLAGYGAPLRILEDPFNDGTPVLEVSPCVLDDGVLGSVSKLPDDERGFLIKSRFTALGEEHRLIAWISAKEGMSLVREIPHNELVPCEDGWKWSTDQIDCIHGIALEFRRHRLGSWFDHVTWSEVLSSKPPGPLPWTAFLLRAWKAPLLQNEGYHLRNVVAWLRKHWVEILPAWISPNFQFEHSGIGWPNQVSTEHWQGVVNELLTSAFPFPDAQSTGELVASLTHGAKGAEALGRAVWQLADVCPILTARIIRTYLREFLSPIQQRHFLSQMLACPDFAIGDQRAEEIARTYGQRDSFWLQHTIPTWSAITQSGPLSISRAYRLLVKKKDYRFYALGTWLSEIH